MLPPKFRLSVRRSLLSLAVRPCLGHRRKSLFCLLRWALGDSGTGLAWLSTAQQAHVRAAGAGGGRGRLPRARNRGLLGTCDLVMVHGEVPLDEKLIVV